MLLNDGNELLFWIDSVSCDKSSIYLSHIETDSKGMKFTGGILPLLWDFVEGIILGPNLYDDDYVYLVVDVDYRNHWIWLERISF